MAQRKDTVMVCQCFAVKRHSPMVSHLWGWDSLKRLAGMSSISETFETQQICPFAADIHSQKSELPLVSSFRLSQNVWRLLKNVARISVFKENAFGGENPPSYLLSCSLAELSSLLFRISLFHLFPFFSPPGQELKTLSKLPSPGLWFQLVPKDHRPPTVFLI